MMGMLDHFFGQNVIALNSVNGREFPPRSPDLNVCDYYLWGKLKDMVYKPMPNSLNEVSEKISHALDSLTIAEVSNAQKSVLKRAQRYIQSRGGHFEK